MSRTYIEAAEVLKTIMHRKGGLKSAVYESGMKEKRMAYALVTQTLKYKSVLEEIVASVKPLREGDVKKEVMLVMLYEHLFGQKIRGGGQVKRLIVANDGAIQKKLEGKKCYNTLIRIGGCNTVYHSATAVGQGCLPVLSFSFFPTTNNIISMWNS